MTPSEPNWTPLLVLGGIFAIGYLLSDDPKPQRRRTRVSNSSNVKNLTLVGAPSREELRMKKLDDGVDLGEKPPQEDPKTLINSPSTTFRREKYPSSERSLTSKNILISRSPLIVPCVSYIRKYPDSYYSLSSKQQWKFRKNLNGENS